LQHKATSFYGVQVINREIFALLGAEKIDLFVIQSGASNPQCRWTFPYENLIDHGSIRLGRLIPSTEVTSLTFSIGSNVYALRVPHDFRNSKATLAQDLSPLQGHDSFVNLQGLRNCWANVGLTSADLTEFHIGIHTNYSLGVHAGHARITQRDRPENVKFTLTFPYEANLFDIVEFDEWVGTIVLVTSRLRNGHFEQDIATILTVQGLGEHVLNEMCA
jgi:hypothetical protein